MNVVTYLRNLLLGKLTTDVVMKAFNKTITLLKEVELQHSNESVKQLETANEAMTASNVARAEALKAAATRAKLEAIVNA